MKKKFNTPASKNKNPQNKARRKSLTKNDLITDVYVKKLAEKGQFLARLGKVTKEADGMSQTNQARGNGLDKPILLPYVVPGERVNAHILKVGDNYAFAKVSDILEPSPFRVKSKCAHFKSCGGCDFQHIDYVKQKAFKGEQLLKAIEPYNVEKGTDGTPSSKIGRDYNGFSYRYKSQFDVRFNNGTFEYGISKARTNTFVSLNECPITHPDFIKILEEIKSTIELQFDEFRRLSTTPAKTSHASGFPKGLLPFHHIQFKKGYDNKEIMVVFVSSTQEDFLKQTDVMPQKNALSKLSKQLSKVFPQITSIWLNQVEEKTNDNLGNTWVHLEGSTAISYELLGVKHTLSPASFMQANGRLIKDMWSLALNMLAPKPDETLLDIYSGTCGLSVYLARHFKQVLCVESSPSSCKDAKTNIQHNEAKNVSIHQADAVEFMEKFNNGHENPDVILVDPPRSGLQLKVLEGIVALKPKKILYISCQLASLKRDLSEFFERGYKVTRAEWVDMFSQTHHMESMILLETSSQ